jgi:uncharacterized membrane protein
METPNSTSSIDGLHVVDQTGSNVLNVGGTERLASAAIGFLLLRSGLRNGGLLSSVLGGFLLYRGASGNCPVYSRLGLSTGNAVLHKTDAVNIRTTIVVNKPRQEVYDFWRRLENLPRFMKHLNVVTESDNKRSHWEAKVPGGIGTITWDAEVLKEENGTYLSWRSLENATIENAGKVEFRDFMNHKGTEIDVTITYRPPAGSIGSGFAWLFNGVFEKMIREDIRNFKQFIETGKVPAEKVNP